MIINAPAKNPLFVILLTIQESTLTVDLNVTIQKWCSTFNSLLVGMSGAAISLNALLQVSQSVTLSHYLFRYSNKRPNTYEDANPEIDKTTRSKNKSKPDRGTTMLQPAGTLSLKDIHHIKDEGKIKNHHLLVMKVIRNTKEAALCINFLLGDHCDSTDPCG